MWIAVAVFLFLISWNAHAGDRRQEARLEADRINAEIERQGARWTADVTEVSMLDEEQQQRLMGAQLPTTWDMETGQLTQDIPKSLPDAFDWRDNSGNYITDPKNQRDCGSCWAFAGVGALEAQCNIAEMQPGRDLDLSEQVLLSCSGGDCDGEGTNFTLNFLQSDGTTTEACSPYEAEDDLPCSDVCPDYETEPYFIDTWTSVGSDVDEIKTALLTGPVVAQYEVFEDFMYYDDGVYSHVSGDSLSWHAIVIIGWDDTDEAWIVKNSWGPLWGENSYGTGATLGYFRIAWGECSINNWPRVIQIVNTPTCPDTDGDGHTNLYCGGTDCDDTRFTVYPDAPEVCDHLDNDCDGVVDENLTLYEYFEDGDGDWYGRPGTTHQDCGLFLDYADNDLDCDDDDPTVNPGAEELCNGEDEDCDGLIDEGAELAFYLDEDLDGYGVDDTAQWGCDGPYGWVTDGGDCNDADVLVHPGRIEICDGIDNNCRDGVDEDACPEVNGEDEDEEGFGEASGKEGCVCHAAGGSTRGAGWLLGLGLLVVVMRRVFR